VKAEDDQAHIVLKHIVDDVLHSFKLRKASEVVQVPKYLLEALLKARFALISRVA
jgi:hypothetical protein